MDGYFHESWKVGVSSKALILDLESSRMLARNYPIGITVSID